MKTTVRIMAGILCVFFGFSFLSACGGTPKDPAFDQEETDRVLESDYRDFYEEEFWALYHIGTDHWNFFWPEPTTEDKERTRAESAEVEALLNCKLMEEGSTSPNANFWQQRFAVGDYKFHYAPYSVATSPIYAMYNAGFLQSWNNISAVDLTDAEKWGDANKQAANTFGGELYVESGGKENADYGRLLYNQIMVKEMASETPLALYEQGKWTWDTFEQYLADVTLKTPERTIYGMSVYATDPASRGIYPLTCIFSNGGKVVRFDDDGSARLALTDPDAIEALVWAEKIVKTGNVVFDTVFPPETWAQEGSVFALAHSSFGISTSGSSRHWGLDNLEDFRFIVFPVGPKGNENATGAFSTYVYGTVLMYGNDKEDSGYVWNARKDVCAQYKAENEDLWIRKTFFGDDVSDDSSYQQYKKACDFNDLTYVTQFGDSATLFFDTLYDIAQGAKTPMEGISGMQSMMQGELDVAFAK